MGKMRFKLSHVMPNAWFYKLKEVGKPRDNHAYKASSDTPRKSIYTSPINHKAIDIPFPADTPKKSPGCLTEPPPLSFTEGFTALDQLHLVELSDECRPSIVVPQTSIRNLDDSFMTFSFNGDDLHGLSSSAPDANAGVVTCGVNLDVRELERRLKALGSEDRRKYYTSPMLLSVAVPSPMIDDGTLEGVAETHDEGLEYPLGMRGAKEFSLDVGSVKEYAPADVWGTKNEERSPLMNVLYEEVRSPPLMMNIVHADDGKPYDGCVSIGDGMFDESNQHSTSSSDTGFERGSSSMWERDAFSITSDGSEAFTTTCTDDIESVHKSRQRFRNLREARMSPSLYTTVHMQDSRLSRFCDDNQEVELADNDIMSAFYMDALNVAGDIQDVRGCASHACDRDAQVGGDVVHDENDRAALVSNSDVHVGIVGRKKWSIYNSKERPSSTASPNKSFNFSSKQEGSMHRVTQPLDDYDEGSNSLSIQYDTNNALSGQYDSSDDWHGEGMQRSSGEFSYARCKERLLSSSTNFARSRDAVMIECEKEKLSNYTKFKLKQRGFVRTKLSASNGGMYLDPGLYNNVSRDKQQSYAYDGIDSTDVGSLSSVRTIPSRLSQHSECTQWRRSRTSVYHNKSPSNQARGLAGQIKSKINAQDQGQIWFKGTLRAVREKTKDPSFEQFSPSTSSVGGMPSTAARSRVFDSFAMVKCSYDPKKDFKESMVEMIMEKDLHSSHDMVELLQCYLTLNADGYHDIIVKVFTEVWSEMFQHI